MKSSIPIAVAFIAMWLPSTYVSAEVVNLVVDSTVSNVDLSINNSDFENSSLSGSAVIDVQSSSSPFVQAQITDLDLTLDDALNINLFLNIVTATTTAGDITIAMDTPGPAASVSGGTFSQTDNLLAFAGAVQINDPINAVGGSQTLDLSTLSPEPTDFDDFAITRVDDTLTVSGNFSIVDSVEVSTGVFIPVVANGFLSASGVVAVPEPSSAFLLFSAVGVLVIRRSRN